MAFSFTVRRAEIGDAEAIARLASELGYTATPEQISERLSALLAAATHFVFVAATPTGLLGWIHTERRLLLESGEKAEIVGLIVGSQVRRLGVGRSLMAAAERWAAAQQLKSVTVRSNIVRLESHPFYEGLGYVRKKTQHSYAKALSAI